MGRHQPLFQAPGDLDSAEHVFVALVKIQQKTIAGNLKCKQVTRYMNIAQDMAADLRLRPSWNKFTPKFEPGDTPSPVGTSPCDG